MSGESIITGYLMVFGIVAMGLAFYQLDNPSGPQLIGWNDLQSEISTNRLNLLVVAFEFNQNPNCGWDIGCGIGNVVDAIVTPLIGLFTLISWLIGTLKAVGVVLFSFTTFSFSPSLPSNVQMLLWPFSGTFWFLIVIMFVKIIRGNEG